MANAQFRSSKCRYACFAVLLAAFIFSFQPPGGFAAEAILSDNRLFANGRSAYLDKKWIEAIKYLYAYRQRNPDSIADNRTRQSQIDNAIGYAEASLDLALRPEVSGRMGPPPKLDPLESRIPRPPTILVPQSSTIRR